jgi:ATP-dependent DNA ligase
MGLEGIVAKRRDRPYRSGRSSDWIKIKNPDARRGHCADGASHAALSGRL